MTRAEFRERFIRIKIELPKIFQKVRDENVIELARVMASGDQERIDEIQQRMNNEAQQRIAALSKREGVSIEFGEIEFDASEDFKVKVDIEDYFFEAIPPDQMPA